MYKYTVSLHRHSSPLWSQNLQQIHHQREDEFLLFSKILCRAVLSEVRPAELVLGDGGSPAAQSGTTHSAPVTRAELRLAPRDLRAADHLALLAASVHHAEGGGRLGRLAAPIEGALPAPSVAGAELRSAHRRLGAEVRHASPSAAVRCAEEAVSGSLRTVFVGAAPPAAVGDAEPGRALRKLEAVRLLAALVAQTSGEQSRHFAQRQAVAVPAAVAVAFAAESFGGNFALHKTARMLHALEYNFMPDLSRLTGDLGRDAALLISGAEFIHRLAEKEV